MDLSVCLAVCLNHLKFSFGPPDLFLLLNLGTFLWMLQACNSVPLYVQEYQENGPLFSELKFYQRAAKPESSE